MERNPNDSLSTGASGANGGSSSNSGGMSGGASALGSGTDSISVTGTGAGQSAATGGRGNTGGDVGSLDLGSASQGGTQSLQDRAAGAKDMAADRLSQARDMAGERLGQVKEKATQLKATLADKLEAGAGSLRQEGGPQMAGGGAMADSNAQLAQLKSTGADVMQKSAEFLRNGDLRASVEEQMRTNPGRTLLFAVGIGYILGKAIRGDRR